MQNPDTKTTGFDYQLTVAQAYAGNVALHNRAFLLETDQIAMDLQRCVMHIHRDTKGQITVDTLMADSCDPSDIHKAKEILHDKFVQVSQTEQQEMTPTPSTVRQSLMNLYYSDTHQRLMIDFDPARLDPCGGDHYLEQLERNAQPSGSFKLSHRRSLVKLVNDTIELAERDFNKDDQMAVRFQHQDLGCKITVTLDESKTAVPSLDWVATCTILYTASLDGDSTVVVGSLQKSAIL